MENFNEFETAGTVPNRDSGNIISHAFNIYKGIFIYPLVIAILVVVIAAILFSVTGFLTYITDFSEQMRSSGSYDADAYREIYTSGPFITFTGIFSIFAVLLFSPLYVGVIYISHKYNLKKPISFSDLFIGFRQNTVNIIIYGFIFYLLYNITWNFCYIPFFIIMPFFFLGYPFLLFQNSGAIEAIQKSFDIVKNNYTDFLVIHLLGAICSYLGFLGCCIGIIFTYMFYYSTMYSAYCAYVALPRELE